MKKDIYIQEEKKSDLVSTIGHLLILFLIFSVVGIISSLRFCKYTSIDATSTIVIITLLVTFAVNVMGYVLVFGILSENRDLKEMSIALTTFIAGAFLGFFFSDMLIEGIFGFDRMSSILLITAISGILGFLGASIYIFVNRKK